MQNHFLPAAFYFKVSFQGAPPIGDVAFRSVTGLDVEMEVESLKEGGVNEYEHKLPKQVKHGNLVLKRAMMPAENNLGTWVRDILENPFNKTIQTRNVEITLLNEDGDPMYYWTCVNAYPVKWSMDGFDSQKNEIAIETLELIYTELKRGQ